MFGFLRKKLKETIEKFTRKAEPKEDIEETEEVRARASELEEEFKKFEAGISDFGEHEKREKEPQYSKAEKGQKDVAESKEKIKISEEPKLEEALLEKTPLEEAAKAGIKTEPSERPDKTDAPKPKLEATELKPAGKLIEKPAEPRSAKETKTSEERPGKKGILGRIVQSVTTQVLSEKKFEELFWDLEVALMESNVAVEVIEKIKQDLKKSLVKQPIKRGQLTSVIKGALKDSIKTLFLEGEDILNLISQDKPYVIMFVGINGSGKTTTIAKIANMLAKNNKKVVLAAADTFRAAAIQQLEEHAKRIGVKIIKHDYGSDPAAVAYDAVQHAKSTGKDVVLVDTAGRLHTNTNLIDEMKKIVRVVKPELKLFVGESIAGNDFISQAEEFDKAIGIDGIILAKADVDEKGGAAVSVSYVTKKPILYMGTGQNYDDLVRFDPKKVVEGLGL